MILYPAIDIKDRRCVRLLKGNMNKETVFNTSPENQAKSFENLGCEWIHIVDLNGAFEGKPINHQAVKSILNKVNIPIQLGGGIRSIDTIEYWIAQGLSRIIIGTAAINNPELIKLAAKEFPHKIAVGIDARNGYVATDGWARTSSVSALDLAKKLEDVGVCSIIYTDIDRDGTMSGPNIDQTKNLADSIKIPVIASGGISSLEDLKKLKESKANLDGVISGRAIYDKVFTINEAMNTLRS